MEEHRLRLPPWTYKRRLMTTLVIVVYIMISAGFIGAGFYQIGIQTGRIPQPLTKERVLDALVHDAGFFRAVKHEALQRGCSNTVEQFQLNYSAPLHPIETRTPQDLCHTFITLHPTGTTITITLEQKNQSRAGLVNALSNTFTVVETELLQGTTYETSKLAGVKDGILTQIYVLGTSDRQSWVVTYAPTSTLVDSKVLDLVLSFRLDHK